MRRGTFAHGARARQTSRSRLLNPCPNETWPIPAPVRMPECVLRSLSFSVMFLQLLTYTCESLLPGQRPILHKVGRVVAGWVLPIARVTRLTMG
jgi:hypothetical protein